MEAIWFTAFMLGLVGGGHCAGMCGGIVGALTLSPGGRTRPVAFALAYHAGRASSYALAGAIVGVIGEAGLALRGSLEVQRILFATASVALLLAGLSLAGWAPVMRPLEAAGGLLWRHLQPWSRALIPATTPARAVMLGALWGWLPCGMVYAALLLSLGSGSIAGGAITMLAFALGTTPGLIAIGVLASTRVGRPANRRLRVAGGAVVAAVGVYGLVQLVRHDASLADFCRLPFAG